ncbi:unnamed protein product [Durusdinium trenchii]|uniref:Uncharacterized protein n=1 Tax=Durusdinium trenchii TaxID=1381693 RepID=A0ABP0HK89_9DINO
MSGYPALNFLTKLVQTLTDALARHIQGYQEMAAAGFSVYDLWQAGCPLVTLKLFGFRVQQFRESGFDLILIRDAGFSKMDMIYGGYSKDEVLAAFASFQNPLAQ